MNIYFGVDGGGTKTELVALDEEGLELGRWFGGPSNPNAIGLEPAAAELAALLRESMAALALKPHTTISLCLGMAGVAAPEEGRRLSEALWRELEPVRMQTGVLVQSLFVTHDAEIALMAALGSSHGALAIAGTGSIVYGQTPDGANFRVGGWGHLLGDEGSGYRIGLDALQAVMRSYDGVAAPTRMTEQICTRYGWNHITELKAYIYRPQIRKQDIADFARFALQAAAEGDAAARELVERNALGLALQAAALLGKHPWFAEGFLVLSGSIFRHSPLFNAVFRQKLADAFPKVRMHETERSAAYGAARLAARRSKAV